MAVDASISSGQVTNAAYKTSEQRKAEENTAKNDLDKQAFLKLLVAQMKYQDPMQPTENTEYVSQLAQFSSLEAMNNVSQSVDLQRATGLIGKVVTATKSDSITGVTTEKTGSVQFVSQSGSKTYVTIDGDQYELDEVSKIWDDEYAAAYNMSNAWSKALKEIPNPALINSTNKDTYRAQVSALFASYASMDDYSRSFIAQEDQEKLSELLNQYRVLGDDLTGATQAAQAASSASEEKAETEASSEERTDDEIVEALVEDTEEDS